LKSVALIALDWGTSNLRASLLDTDGNAIENRSAPGGVMAVVGGAFEQSLLALCGDWLAKHDCALIASGMIGSRQGWKEAPYLDCPADITKASRELTVIPVKLGDGQHRLLHIAPGLRFQEKSGAFDVMRGEEIQIWGARLAPGSRCILPGTHSKWAWTGSEGEVLQFQTWMTGELFGLHTKHGILGRLMQQGQERMEDFRAGVKLGLVSAGKANHVVFAARTAGLMGQVAPEGLPDYLSGILIGLEVASATAEDDSASRNQAITLIGDDGLCERYGVALELAGLAWQRSPPDATTHGQWLIAKAAGLTA
jgi:2-dehydro-3-deoxygalactonokinase